MKFPTAPGTCFKFTASSAAEAAKLLREQLGEEASVLSVRSVERSGLLGLFTSPRLEVVARVGGAADDGRPKAEDGSLMPEAKGPGARSTVAGPLSPIPDAAARRSLDDLLARSGFSPAVLARLRSSPAWPALRAEPLHRGLVQTGRVLASLATAGRPDPAPLTRPAFIGAPGVGRTTALCKWIAAEVFRRGRLGHVVTAAFDRPNPAGPLPVFCEALGVPLAHFPASTRPATPGGFVGLDLPGMSVRRPAENAALRALLDREQITERVLVLNAAYEASSLAAARAAGGDLGATHVVFTHLDEVAPWGRLWDQFLEGGLTPLFLSTGPSLTGEIESDPVDAVARRTFPGSEIAGGDFSATGEGGRMRSADIGHHVDERDADEAELPIAILA